LQSIDERAEQKVIVDAVRTAINGSDYDALNAMEREYRLTRARTGSGSWKLSILHGRILAELGSPGDGQCSDRSSAFFRGWLAKSPDEPAAIISHAAVVENYAWCIRGGGYAREVGRPALDAFADKVAEARRLLDEHRATASVDPHFYAVMERIYIDQAAGKAEFKRLLDEATAREPDYHYLYYDAYRYFQPQWYGSSAEIDQIARYAAERTSSSEGLGMYARYYWFATDCNCPIEGSIDWPLMKRAMRDVMERYPTNWNAANFARISCTMGDPDEAAIWFARDTGDHSVAWSDYNAMLQCERQIRPQRSSERCPFAAAEGWSIEDIDKYCR
jgi:hypothetical protein